MNRRSLTAQVMVTLALACAPSSVWAQAPRATGPFAGLFGGRTEATHTLDFRGSLFGTKQDVAVPPEEQQAGPLDDRFRNDGYRDNGTFGGATGALAYSYDRRAEGEGFFVRGRGAVSDYTIRPERPDLSFGADSGVTTKLTRRIDFGSSANVSYSPFLSFSPLGITSGVDPNIGVPSVPYIGVPGFAFAMVQEPNITLNGGLGFTVNFTRRSSMAVDGSVRQMRFVNSAANDVLSYGTGAMFRYQVTRTLGFHAGYGQGITRYTGSPTARSRSESIDVGVDYGDAVALGRRTTFSFSTSTVGVRLNDETRWRLNGSAGISRGIGRTWSTSAGYIRGIEYVAGFTEPVLSDSATGSFGGMLGRRVSWTSGGGVSRGQIGFITARRFITYSVTSGMSFAISRMLGVYGQYGYYHHDIPVGSTALGVLTNLGRQTVSAGLTLWIPIVNNGRADRDTR